MCSVHPPDMNEFMNRQAEQFFEVVIDRTGEIAVVIQAQDAMQAWQRARRIQHQLYHPNFERENVQVRDASLPFTAPTFSTGYFHMLDDAQSVHALQ